MSKVKELISKRKEEEKLIIEEFCEKQELDEPYLIGENIYCFIDQYYFNIEDIILDIKEDAPQELILKWQDDTLEYHSHKDSIKDYTMPYSEYIKGERYQIPSKHKHLYELKEIDSIGINELDFEIQEELIKDSDLKDEDDYKGEYIKYNYSAESFPIKIDEIRKIISELEKKGATYITIDPNLDHYGYDIQGIELIKLK